MGGASSEHQVHVFGGRSNDYSDGTDDRLIRLEKLGWVHHRHNETAPGIKPQPSALKHAQDDPFVSNSDWAMVFDADEFLCIKYGDRPLGDMIARGHQVGVNGIVITWHILGQIGRRIGPPAPVTGQSQATARVDGG